jgi:hypothetical protein
LLQENTPILEYLKKLQKWISMQRYAYALKHGLKVNSDHKRSCIKFVRTLTDSREQKLKNINFIFVQPRDEGRNQARREQMLSRAMQYYDEHGNLTASAYVDQPLNSWLIQQCKKLQDDSQLSSMGILRKQKLLSIRFTF